MVFVRIEPGSLEGDMIALYESFFRGSLLLDRKKNIVDLSHIEPVYPQYSHYRFLVNHLKGLGFTVIEKGDRT
jgi:hypothetical protein